MPGAEYWHLQDGELTVASDGELAGVPGWRPSTTHWYNHVCMSVFAGHSAPVVTVLMCVTALDTDLEVLCSVVTDIEIFSNTQPLSIPTVKLVDHSLVMVVVSVVETPVDRDSDTAPAKASATFSHLPFVWNIPLTVAHLAPHSKLPCLEPAVLESDQKPSRIEMVQLSPLSYQPLPREMKQMVLLASDMYFESLPVPFSRYSSDILDAFVGTQKAPHLKLF